MKFWRRWRYKRWKKKHPIPHYYQYGKITISGQDLER